MVIAPVTLECVGHMTLIVGSLPLEPTTIRYQTIICAPSPLVNGSSVVPNMPTNGKNVNMLNALTSHNVCMRQNTQLRQNISLWPSKQMRNATQWDNIKVRVMEYIIHAKWNCCERFRQTLMSTAGLTVAEATQDMFWGIGAAPNLVQQTKPDKFQGENQHGKGLT